MTRDEIIAMAREAGLQRTNPGEAIEVVRFAGMIAVAEREALEALYADAQEIFNSNPGETSQDVRDVIEWYAASIRARGEK